MATRITQATVAVLTYNAARTARVTQADVAVLTGNGARTARITQADVAVVVKLLRWYADGQATAGFTGQLSNLVEAAFAADGHGGLDFLLADLAEGDFAADGIAAVEFILSELGSASIVPARWQADGTGQADFACDITGGERGSFEASGQATVKFWISALATTIECIAGDDELTGGGGVAGNYVF